MSGSPETVLVYGNFTNLHTGHFRLLKFASELGSNLVVGINLDNDMKSERDFNYNIISQLKFVNQTVKYFDVFDLIREFRPKIVVKGKEFENQMNPERELIEQLGGTLIFSSGDFHINETDLIEQNINLKQHVQNNIGAFLKLNQLVNLNSIQEYMNGMKKLRVCVLGDLIVDRYVECRALGMSREDSLVVHTPIKQNDFIGGAGIVAAHCSQLGAKTQFLTVVGSDDIGKWATSRMEAYGVSVEAMVDDSRTTTLKERFRIEGKSVFRMSRLQIHSLQPKLRNKLLQTAREMIDKSDAVIFSDFSYGVLDEQSVRDLLDYARERKKFTAADSQSSSQIGSLSKFAGCDLITPTEQEVRIEVKSNTDGLAVLLENVKSKVKANQIIMKLGSDGILLDDELSTTKKSMHQIPAFNQIPKDVSGAGDSLLAAATLSLIQGSSLFEAGFIGSVCAAIQVSREGNIPTSNSELAELLEKFV